MTTALTIRNVEIEGRTGLDVRLARGLIAEIGQGLAGGGEVLDGRGGALIPGLADHHIHLLALAAQDASLSLHGVATLKAFEARIQAALAELPVGAWLRITGYHEAMAGDLDRGALDALAPVHRLRIQHQTGSLWVLNSQALDAVRGGDEPEGLERGSDGRLTGRVWRADAWLRERIGAAFPNLTAVGRRLSACGITALTDASVTTDAAAATHLAQAVRASDLPQRLTLMSGGALEPANDGAYAVGPVKVLLDDHALPDFDDFLRRVADARRWRRAVAVHCVTAAELALTLAVFETAGARPGDRIEHGGIIPEAAIAQIRALGLTVVTQSAFVGERGDRYLAEVALPEQVDLYRCASLMAAGVPVAGSSDAPYASIDPWVAMATAVGRRTRAGHRLGGGERIGPAAALGLYLGAPDAPGGPARRIAVGAAADLCLLDAPLAEALADPAADRVSATLVGGRVVFAAA